MAHEVGALLRDRVRLAGLDALVSAAPENIAYAAGFVVPSQPLMRWRHAAHVLTADGKEAMVCVDMEESTVSVARPELDLRVWQEFGGDPMTTLAELLRVLGVEHGRIGIEREFLPVSAHDRLVERLPDAVLVPADEMLSQARQCKTEPELELLTKLSRIADEAIADAFAEVKAGDSEMDLAGVLTRRVYELGAEQFKLMIVATGERSQLPNVGPTDRVLRPGDVCRVEIFPVKDGYHAGVCRTAIVGDPSPEAERVYTNLIRCKASVLDAIRPGATVGSVYRSYREVFDELCMPPIAFVGHGIGTDLHEEPYLGESRETVLRTGMVLGIEPLVYRSGFGFGMQIKDMVAVGERGARLLSDRETSALTRIEG